jgi:hypothetical protein
MWPMMVETENIILPHGDYHDKDDELKCRVVLYCLDCVPRSR